MNDLERLRREAASQAERDKRERMENEKATAARLPDDVARDIKDYWMPLIQHHIKSGYLRKVDNEYGETHFVPGVLWGGRTISGKGRCDEAYVKELQRQLGPPFTVYEFNNYDSYKSYGGQPTSYTIVKW